MDNNSIFYTKPFFLFRSFTSKEMRDKKTIFSHLNHGVIWFIFLITLLLADFSGAQSAGNIPTAPSEPTYPFKQTISKRMAVVLIVLVCFFIFLAVLSVYTRQCANNHFGNNLHPSAAHGGNNNRSRRATRGLDAAVIATFPTFVYSNVKGIKIGKDTLECAICLCEFEDDETLRLLAKCNHVFHVDCIDAWLVSHSTCPVCRASLVPKPGDISFAALLNSDSGMDVTRPDEGTGSGNGDVVVRIVGGNDDENQGVGLISPVRSRSTGWRLTGLFPRSHSTGHLLVRRGENEERYTLRLPEEVRNELVNSNLNRARSCVVLPRMQSSRQGYRTRSGNTRSDRRIFFPTFEKNENENENNDHNRPFTRLRADNDGQGQ